MRPTWIVAIVVVVLAAGIAGYSVESIGSTSSNSGTLTPSDNSSSLNSSVYTSSTNQSTVESSSVSSSSSVSTSASTSTRLNTTSSLNTTTTTDSPGVGLVWFGAEAAPGSCANETADASFGTGDGYTLKTFLTPTPHADGQFPMGSTICIHTYLENTGNQSTSLPSMETVKITSVIGEGSSGIIFYESNCSAPGNYTGSFGPNSSAWNCVSSWDTSKPYNGNVPTAAGPLTYEAIVNIKMADSYAIQVIFSIDLAASG